ncbi:uncharacterized protein HGUI_03888 [Hanseniaspora guilliermondii]|uniref:MIF4G domain-containing protein n=1 Tax=Hanseniaspora guilliermondii TaxID=56406 RepID=A0A1L0D3E9_9ASCO|nr:uncharacterized protein HGUI_03888 [Hanseniaspora guilliermondii]
MSEETSKKTYTFKPQNKGEYQKPQHPTFKMNNRAPGSMYTHTAPHMINPMVVPIPMTQAENTVNETNKVSTGFNAPQSSIKTGGSMPESVLKKIKLASDLASKVAAAKKAAEEAAAKKAEEEAAAKKAEEEAAAKKAEEEAAAAKKAEEEAAAAKKAEEEAAAAKKDKEETASESNSGNFKKPLGQKSFASRFAQTSQDNKKQNFNPPSPSVAPFVPEAGIPVSLWLEHMKTLPDDESTGRVYTFDDIFELSQYNVVRDEVWHKKLAAHKMFDIPVKKVNDKKKSSYNNDSKRNDSKWNKSKRNNDRYSNRNESKHENNFSKIPSKGVGLAISEEEAAAKKKAEEEEAAKLANVPKITTSEKGWKPKKKTQAQVVNIVTESGEEILSPQETEKQLKSLLNKLTAENYSSVSAKIINLMNQSRFKEDKMKSLPKTIEMTIFKGCDESQWGMIYARLIGDCMKHLHPDTLPFFKEYFLKAEKYKRYDLEEELEEKGIPKSEWPPFEPGKAIENIPPHYAINYFLGVEMMKYDINGDSEEDIWNVKEGEEDENVEMMSDEYYRVIGKKRRYLGLYKIIGYLYNINALQHDIINVRFSSLVKNIVNASSKGLIKDDIIEALLEFVSTINKKYSAYCKASGVLNSLNVTLDLGNKLIQSKSISSRMAFKFEEYSEASFKDQAHTDKNEIKSLDEVRAEALKEIQRKKMEEKERVQEYRNNSRNNKSKRNGRGFGSNRNQSFKNTNSGNWNVSGTTNNNTSRNESKSGTFRSAPKTTEEPSKQSIKNAFEMLSFESE